MSGFESLNTKNMLKVVVFFQYVPRLLRIVPLYKEVTRTSGILTETAWAGAAFNLFLYMLASHVSPCYILMFMELFLVIYYFLLYVYVRISHILFPCLQF
jgi:cyclic nucleotide gated channel